jgi:TonB family protein
MTTAKVRILGLILLGAHAWASVWRPERIVGLEYPESALIRGLEGVVEIECYIANDGSVARAEPVSGEAELAPVAIRNAMQWKFRRINSGDATYTLTYRFQIQKVSKTSVLPGFRFVMPGQVFITARAARP